MLQAKSLRVLREGEPGKLKDLQNEKEIYRVYMVSVDASSYAVRLAYFM